MPKPGKARLNILFIGNSFTSRNELPSLIARIAVASNCQLTHHLITRGGASLRMHWNGGAAAREITTGRYDFVVLQEQSTLPIKNAARMRENVLLFDEMIRGAGSRTALYLTWARAHAPESQANITEAYTSLARETGATLIPAGVAWQMFMKRHDQPILHDRDGSHPTLAGSFLAACVAFRALFHRAPEKLPELNAIKPEDAARLDAVAAQAMQAAAEA
ncbi:MAG TPA: hypothetical protein VF669_19840 [Tepidisphaeraceae bacterium]|jgi:hypothetical protein